MALGIYRGNPRASAKKRAVLLVGLIWGAWHYPLIWMGFNYPGQPVAGTILMATFYLVLAYVFGYALLKQDPEECT